MKAIINNFDVDYVIKIPVSDKIKLNEASIITTREFLLNEIVDRSKFDQQNNIKKVVVFGEEISFETTDYDDASLYFNKSKTVKEEKVSKIIKNDPNMKKDLSKVRNSKSINVKENTNYDTKNENRIEISSSYVDKSTNATSAHEIKKIATSNFRTNSTYKLRTDSISNLEGIILHPKGIHNPSVYCFMNTCMQCLFSIPELNYFFSSQNYKKEIKNKINISGCEALYEFIDSYNSAGRRIKSPQSLFAVCHSFLQPQRQHDCQEFLRKFLSKLQEEMNFNKKYTFPDKITYEKAWNIYREVNPSFIDGIFTGLIRSSVYCNKCQFRSDTYDPFMDLSVPIQRKNMERLENCLDNYFAKEFIDCEYKCSSCKKKTSQLEIAISPPILTLHIKRFESYNNKFNGSIVFSESLDLLQYSNKDIYSSLKYELFAIAVHLGNTIYSGHYIAIVKRDNCWYYISDDNVDRIGLREVLSVNAYMLFYRKI